MKKLRLDPDNLRIDTFEPAVAEANRGTVLGRESDWGLCGENTVDNAFTCRMCDSEGCTNDVYALQCRSYAVACPVTQGGYSCVGSGCTEENTCHLFCQ